MLSFTINWILVLTLVVTVLLPVIVGLVTTEVTNANWKSVILALLSAAVGFGTELLTALNSHTDYDVGTAIIKFLGIFVVAVATHYGFWKPVGVSSAVQAVGSSSGSHTAEVTPAVDPTPVPVASTPVVTDSTTTTATPTPDL